MKDCSQLQAKDQFLPVKSPPKLTQGDTIVLKWKHGKQAVLMLCFDDSAPTHLDYTIPALTHRRITGTFYINPGNGPYRSRQKEWDSAASAPGIVLANHTYSHIGGMTEKEFEREIALANNELDRIYPTLPKNRLRSWGRPGVPDEQWGISEPQINRILKRHLMIERPPFQGPPFTMNGLEEMEAFIGKLLQDNEAKPLVFHGVAGDWHSVSLNDFLSLLDYVEERRDQLWLTDPLTWHCYKTERESARVVLLDSHSDQIRLSLICDEDTNLYHEPLTLMTGLPEFWQDVYVWQDGHPLYLEKMDGCVLYDAVPGGGDVILSNQRQND
ncbi:polysaccharide deacetylase family protein [Cerasicoccus arenae]|uniref:NodB homology domain-containing protein n=1 Tax=Cerasicoccus arenae TaxID=424488 RepID=A0A8J3DHQ6_9BACT|nr:polysaccharide deacetylase family protein [Cerasicoccus arenae]MBK1859605.1 polysaccharide deacetylase family protein [Cerasicoccus arenae]GHC03632.1 hypothetical protein GCM10007047_20310 [Cerasicoccus arenae]